MLAKPDLLRGVWENQAAQLWAPLQIADPSSKEDSVGCVGCVTMSQSLLAESLAGALRDAQQASREPLQVNSDAVLWLADVVVALQRPPAPIGQADREVSTSWFQVLETSIGNQAARARLNQLVAAREALLHCLAVLTAGHAGVEVAGQSSGGTEGHDCATGTDTATELGGIGVHGRLHLALVSLMGAPDGGHPAVHSDNQAVLATQVLANLMVRFPHLSDAAVHEGWIVAVLNACKLTERRPVQREWALLCVRHMCEYSAAAHEFIDNLRAERVMQTPELDGMGLEATIGETGRLDVRQRTMVREAISEPDPPEPGLRDEEDVL